jgi:hypothetical protein
MKRRIRDATLFLALATGYSLQPTAYSAFAAEPKVADFKHLGVAS